MKEKGGWDPDTCLTGGDVLLKKCQWKYTLCGEGDYLAVRSN